MTRSAWIRMASGMAVSCIVTAMAIALASQAMAEETMVTTTVRNGNSISTVTQSGDPAKVTKHVEKRPGYTRIEQQSGNSRSVVVQSSNPADMPKMPNFDKLPKELRDMFNMPDPSDE